MPWGEGMRGTMLHAFDRATMYDLKVPIVPVQIEVLYGKRALSGQIFLPTLASHHTGAPRPDEWINESTEFFPFLETGASRAVILSKHHVVLVSIPFSPELVIPQEEEGLRCNVAIECGELKLNGTLLMEMPGARSRVLDFINSQGAFVPMWHNDWFHLIRKDAITRIVETEEI